MSITRLGWWWTMWHLKLLPMAGIPKRPNLQGGVNWGSVQLRNKSAIIGGCFPSLTVIVRCSIIELTV